MLKEVPIAPSGKRSLFKRMFSSLSVQGPNMLGIPFGAGAVNFLLDAKFYVKCFTCVILFDF